MTNRKPGSTKTPRRILANAEIERIKRKCQDWESVGDDYDEAEYLPNNLTPTNHASLARHA
ncbi:hypothetical protein J8I87_00260 [Paraburkholderia sp. LEh10]|jgi:hypothetical protein|uniref:hypothetical protein n=1 Tax=Paraburkholderia sp. LEh10 TaxID=2821353 RepID=UPI001AE1F53E|nr:hypothetical protein [Paraburkholderia sp. LEh10]MBP0588184.1 hypothetical protein [Paraburkholderia sp. LEh10]